MADSGFICESTVRSKNMWKQPWGYKEGYLICIGLFVTGALLQVTVGNINLDTLSSPVNLFAGLFFLMLLTTLHLLRGKSYLLRWISSYQAAVSSISSMVLMIVIMGLTKQAPGHVVGEKGLLGFSQMVSAWPFALLFLWLIMILTMTILRRLMRVKWGDASFLMNHIGLWLALVGAILGSADMQRLEMTTTAGKAEWRALNERGEVVELPITIELNQFTIEEYPPKLMLVDNETGRALPEGKPVNLLVEDSLTTGHLLDWNISVGKYLPYAASVVSKDSLRFVDFRSYGATTALYVKATNRKNGESHEGWVSCGNFMFPYNAIRLGENMSLIMPEREPQRFSSDVTVCSQSNEVQKAIIQVNKPFDMEGWKIYQLSYDESKGRWSNVSVFQLVKDPWLPVVYTGILMMAAGAILLFATPGNKRKEERNELE